MLTLSQTKTLFPLSGERLSLHLFTQADITADYIGWLNNPQLVKYSNQRFIEHSHSSSQAYLDSISAADALFLSIKDHHTLEAIGTMSCYFNRHHQCADMGILIGNAHYRGQGIGQEAWILLQRTLIETVSVRKVTAGTLACNQSMLKIMKKSGMVEDGIRRQQEIVGGEAFDILHFAAFQ